ncbi:NADP-dependent glyceraldehyde-3-phosphate dehydrogenase, partial [Cucurbita argyrosperma subsp. argyrosperma]
MEIAKSAQESWAKTPLWRRAEVLHKAAAILKEHKAPIAECLVKEIAMPAKDAVTEVVRSGDLVSYCAEEVTSLAFSFLSLWLSGQRCTAVKVVLAMESIADALVEKGCVFTKDLNKAILISNAMEIGTVQINSTLARGPDHFSFQARGIGSQGVTNSINMMTKVKTTVINS